MYIKLTEQETIELYRKYRTNCLNQIILESYKGINRIICIIREWNRKWNKEKENHHELKKDGFIKLFKKETSEGMPDEVLQAYKYL